MSETPTNPSIDREYRCIGPPGCGKTTWLSRQVGNCVSKHGSESVLVMSLTRAAASEVVGRELPIEPEQIGTLHAHAFRAVDSPRIANDGKALSEWNEHVRDRGQPHWKISLGRQHDEDLGVAEDATDGDQLFALMDTYRARMIPRDHWPRGDVIAFAEAWDDWKEVHFLKDFTDLIEICLRDVERAPENPRFIFLDEAQDFSKLELALARKWAQHADQLIVAGDPDQALYTWRGADAKNFVSPEIPDDRYRELEQSYRVPRKPHAVALSWIRQIKERRDVPYHPRNVEGSVRRCEQVFHHPELVFKDAEQYLKDGKSVMFLATASYLLKPMLGFLRNEGVPFHNPYVEKRGDWNPLRSRRGTQSLADRMKAFLYGGWLENPVDLRAWLDLLKLDHFRADRQVTKQFLRELKGPLSIEQLENIFEPEALKKALSTDLVWLRKGLLKEYSSGARSAAFDYVCRIVERSGEKALDSKPQIILGTVHCSPPDEPILTTNRGYVSIADLVPNFDRLVGYMASCNRVVKGTTNAGEGYDFERSVRHYSGTLVTLITSGSRTRVTPNHRLRVRFSSKAQGKFVVYLMRRNNWWRIGVSRAPQTGTNTCVGANTRLARERGDGAWVLRLCETRKEALMQEAIIGARYGIPGLIFESTPSTKARTFTSRELHEIHSASSAEVSARAALLMTDFGLDPETPIWTGKGTVRAGYAFETVAANVLPGLMELPVYREGKRTPDWVPFGVERHHYEGPVYGLHVAPHEHYVSGGAIVHNSVKGGEADVVYVFPDLSKAAGEEYFRTREGYEAAVRVMYVAFTRARETLVLCYPSSSRCVDFPAVA